MVEKFAHTRETITEEETYAYDYKRYQVQEITMDIRVTLRSHYS